MSSPINWYTPRNVYHDSRRLEEQRELDRILEEIRSQQKCAETN